MKYLLSIFLLLVFTLSDAQSSQSVPACKSNGSNRSAGGAAYKSNRSRSKKLNKFSTKRRHHLLLKNKKKKK